MNPKKVLERSPVFGPREQQAAYHAEKQRADQLEQRLSEMTEVFESAFVLCQGYAWNNGNHAILHEYRKKLLIAVNKIRPVSDFESKLGSLARLEKLEESK